MSVTAHQGSARGPAKIIPFPVTSQTAPSKEKGRRLAPWVYWVALTVLVGITGEIWSARAHIFSPKPAAVTRQSGNMAKSGQSSLPHAR